MDKTIDSIRKIKLMRILNKYHFKKRNGRLCVSFDESDFIEEMYLYMGDGDITFNVIYRTSITSSEPKKTALYRYRSFGGDDLDTFIFKIMDDLGIEMNEIIR